MVYDFLERYTFDFSNWKIVLERFLFSPMNGKNTVNATISKEFCNKAYAHRLEYYWCKCTNVGYEV